MLSNPYTLPEGHVQIAVSGGRSSAFMIHHILEVNGDLPDRVEVTFQNTGRERPETLDFVAECARRWGVMITWRSPSESRRMSRKNSEALSALVSKYT